MRGLSIPNKIIFFVNSILLLLLILSYLSPYINPNIIWFFSFLGLIFPFLYVLNIFFLIYWLLCFKRQIWANIIILLIGLNHLNVSHISVPDGGYKSTNLQVKEQKRNMADSSTIGFVGGASTMEAQMSVAAWDNQHNNINKTYENWPMPGGTSLFNQNTNIQIAKRDHDRENNRTYNKTRVIPEGNSVTGIVPSLETYGKINMPQQYNQQMNSDRMNPEILTAFKSNPYAQSLNSY